MKRKNLTAVLLAFAMAAANLTTGTGLVSYANDGGVTFALGDTSGDSTVDAKDASEILAEYSRLSTSQEGYFKGSRAEAADVNKDGKIDSSDASDVLRFYSYVSTGGDLDLAAYLADPKQSETGTATTTSTTATAPANTTTASAVTSTASSAPATASTTTAATTEAPASTTVTAAAPDKVSEIRLSNKECSVEVGEDKLSANVTMFPLTASDKREIWISSDEKVATVDSQGWVTGKSEGSCTITVVSANNPDVKATVELTVTDTKKVKEIRLDRTEFTLEVGMGALSANVTMLPATVTDKREIWSSSDESVAIVDNVGWVIAKSAGTATITVQSANNPDVKATVEVTVTSGTTSVSATTSAADTTTTATSSETATTAASTAAESATTAAASTTEPTTTTAATTLDASRVSAIELSVTSIELSVGEMGISYVTMLPKTALNKNEIWSSSDPKIATVDIYGNITAVREGECTITVRSADNLDVKADVSVKVFPANKVRKINLTATEFEIELGKKAISYVTMLPATAANKDELWVSSDTSIATVDDMGWITSKSAGECVVTVYSVDNPDVKAEIKVKVVSADAPEDAPTESCIVDESSDDDSIAFRTPFPVNGKGRFTLEYIITYGDETLHRTTSILTVPALRSYTTYFKTDRGDFKVTLLLHNPDNGKSQSIGSYEFTVSPQSLKVVSEDIRYAFYSVDGLAANPSK
ncbi:Uncharacterized conserved protein YjdB, contains Ig-like domain [Ruminococcus sp. YRD2003]|uniref:Ig-like domain-containing protein n=1 Tax=Ruminococcus sp. YRD2003 TaxID=1452313 RepID=UPI0008C21702|nr:Uncharacterized conserved protein YjdB, contains Ig-like domain [Ruminococcus flavefaciens]